MDKIVELLINSGLKVKQVQSTADGLVVDYTQSGKPFRIFVAPLKPIPRSIQQSA